jgi:uncharacterized protein YbdZ (MbtH family)
MADSRIRKVVVSPSELPPISSEGDYLLRYRIVSEDKNRFSYWSPIYNVPLGNRITQVSSFIDVSQNNITVTWDDGNDRPGYDIFIRFGTYDETGEAVDWENYFYHGTSPIHTYSLLKENGYTHVGAIIQLEGIEKRVNPILKISESERSLKSIFDGGSA